MGDSRNNFTKLGVLTSVLQVIFSGVFLFILYRYLLRQLGPESVGLWSLVVSSVSVSQIAGFGVSGSLVRFVASMNARGDDRSVSVLVQTAVLFSGFIFCLLLSLGYPLLCWLLELVVPKGNLLAAVELLPYAMVSLWLGLLAGIYQSAIDGCHRVHLRNLIVICCVILNFIFCLILVPHFGIYGVALAQIVQNGFALMLSIWVTTRLISGMPLIPHCWNTGYLRTILPFSAGFQLISVAQMCYDPMTKGLLSKYGGLQDVALYEFASKMVVQLRLLLVSANQAIVPRIAQASMQSAQGLVDIYRRSIELLVFFSVPIFSLLLLNLPSISLYWIGRYSSDFVFYSIILTAGWLINLISGPSYFGYIGEGRLRWNIIGHAVIALLNLLLGIFLGKLYSGKGVVIAWGISLAVGSILVIAFYMYEHRIKLWGLIGFKSSTLVLLCFAWSVSIFYIEYDWIFTNIFFLLSVGILLWINPLREDLFDSARQLYSRSLY